ncbi:serine/threonine-protein kinase [Nocardia thraciensis]
MFERATGATASGDGKWLGHYRLDRLLGVGGTGSVWLAHDTVHGRDVALKVLAAPLAVDATYRQRFTREARMAAQARGSHLVPIHAFGEIDGRLYLDMQYIEGASVAELLRLRGPMPAARAVDVIAQTATALDAVHRAGLVHRDVKPSNIMVDGSGFVYLIDFGTANRGDQPSITATGDVVGTMAYMAPERFDGVADARSDQYSLACVLVECLTGQRPFGDIDSARQLRAHLSAAPPRPSAADPAIPAVLDDVVARGMAKDPSRRWPSAGELGRAARAAVDAPPAGTAVPSGSSALRRLPAPAAATVAFGALAATIGAILWIGEPTGPSGPPSIAVPVPAPRESGPSTTAPPPTAAAAVQGGDIGQGSGTVDAAADYPAVDDPNPPARQPIIDIPKPEGNKHGNGHGNGGRGKPPKPHK